VEASLSAREMPRAKEQKDRLQERTASNIRSRSTNAVDLSLLFMAAVNDAVTALEAQGKTEEVEWVEICLSDCRIRKMSALFLCNDYDVDRAVTCNIIYTTGTIEGTPNQI
jgi:hypothetical protein